MTQDEFKTAFRQLTEAENDPLSWQNRLFEDHFANNDLPSVIDLPTGMGKTMVMAIWLIARSQKKSLLPRRLIYVVDRRTVVDQATDLAEKLAKNCKSALDIEPPAVTTLRGQLADNREWSTDPSRSAIIIGTVDLIGSALLFSSYRAGFKQRPLQAGLLGQDSLLVLDEAHLSKPFEKLICAINTEGPYQKDRDGKIHGAPMKVIRMSATSTGEDATRFNLQDTDQLDSIIKQRFGAKKQLTIMKTVETTELKNSFVKAAIEIAHDSTLRGKRIVVFVRKPDDAKTIAAAIRDHEVKTEELTGNKSTTVKGKPYSDSVEILTGTMRGLERDELLTRLVLRRFLDGNENPDTDENKKPVFLISTSAGEVGFDLNGDHMLSDQTTIDSFIQRLGRVNRRGSGDATIILIPELIKRTDKDGKPRKLSDLEQAIVNTLDMLAGQRDLSPKNIDALKRNAWKEGYVKACSPDPTMVELSDILLDAWSMTSIIEPMPGRPEVAPWLRGIADDLPETTIAWRVELDLPSFDQLDRETIEEWFDTHRLLTHETLSVPTSAAAKWFSDRWDRLEESQRSKLGLRSIIVDRVGLKVVTVKEVIDQISRKNTDVIRNAGLILPASFGGIERGTGLLDPAAPKKPEDKSNADEEQRKANAKLRSVATDVADVPRSEDPGIADVHSRYRELITITEDAEPDVEPLVPGVKPVKFSRLVVELEPDDDRVFRLVSYVPKQEKPEWGSKRQLLSEHITLVRECVDDILSRIDAPGLVKLAAQLAADFHDHGKNRERWQRTVDGTATVGTTDWKKQTKIEGAGKHQTLGKSGGEMKRDPRGYRHEFGSLREFIDEHYQKIDQEVFDLAMHMIAVHHGRGRPHFPKGGFDPDYETRSDAIHTDSIRRFARLQRKYGWWHLAWLENLLRCADAMASSEPDSSGGMK